MEFDAIFIAPTYTQAVHYAKALNYNPRQCLIATRNDFIFRLNGIYPDEDVEVHICGSWFDEDAPSFLYERLLEIEEYLGVRGFNFTTVNRIGERWR